MYGNYYNNPYAGAAPQQQQRLNYLQQQQQMYQPPMYQPPMQPIQSQLKGRIVTSIEEAKAAPVDLDGTITFFPCPAEGKVFEKSTDLNGAPVFRVYQIVNPQEQKPIYAERNSVDKLTERVEKLEKQIGGMNHESVNDNADVAK